MIVIRVKIIVIMMIIIVSAVFAMGHAIIITPAIANHPFTSGWS